MRNNDEHFEKRLKERFLWDIKTLREKSREFKMETFTCPKKLNERYQGMGQLIREEYTKIRIIEDLNFVLIQVGFELKTCYRLWGN